MVEVKVLYDMDNGEVNFNYQLSSPESGYYASSPESVMTMGSPEYTGNSYEMNYNDYRAGIRLVALKTPQTFFRFRYESEMHGTHGSLMGQDSSKEIKTFPTIQVTGVHLLGEPNPRIRVRCSLHQTEKQNDLPHSHKLVIKNGDQEKFDPHFIDATEQNGYVVEFKGMGIIHTAKKDIVEELGKKLIRLKEFELERSLTEYERQRESSKVRPINVKSMNLNQVCLCFEAFHFDRSQSRWVRICPPIYSDPIKNIKSALTGELKICNYNTCVSSVIGGQEVYLLVEKVNRGDIKVRFFDNNGWQDFAQIDTVHHQYAIVLRTPPYKNQTIEKPVQVWMQLYRTKDGCVSVAREFTYKPIDSCYEIGGQKRKIRRIESNIPTVVENVVSSTTTCDDDFESIDLAGINLNIPLSPEDRKKILLIRQELEESSSREGLQQSNSTIEYDSVHVDEEESKRQKLHEKKEMEITYYLHNLLERFIRNGNVESFTSVMDVVKSHNLLRHIHKVRNQGMILLHLACKFGRENFLSELIDQNTDTTVIENNNGNTPLHTCVEEDQPGCLKILLRHKPDLEIKNYNGLTPLHLSIKLDHMTTTKILVEHGASFFAIESNTYDTVLHTAVERKSLKMIKYILRNTGTQLLNKLNGVDKTPLDILYESEEEASSDEIEKEIEKCLLDVGGWSIHVVNDPSEVNDDLNESDNDPETPTEAVQVNSYTNYISPETLQVLNDLASTTKSVDEIDTQLNNLSIEKTPENPIKFDSTSKTQLCAILNTTDSWRQCAILLGLENLCDIWGRQDNPSQCLLAYIEGCNFELQTVIDTLDTLDLRDAISVIDAMVARQL